LDNKKDKIQYILDLASKLEENSEPSDENSDDEELKNMAKFKKKKMKVKKTE